MLADDRSRFLTDLGERIGDIPVDGESLLGERALNVTVEPVPAGVESAALPAISTTATTWPRSREALQANRRAICLGESCRSRIIAAAPG